jgi:hypothetical protein
MKPYNDAEARAGAPVVTRDGRKARIICFDCRNPIYPIIALIDYGDTESISSYTAKGTIYQSVHAQCDTDLFMDPTKRTGWVNVYSDSFGEPYVGNNIHKTKDDADKFTVCRIACVQIEWEE